MIPSTCLGLCQSVLSADVRGSNNNRSSISQFFLEKHWDTFMPAKTCSCFHLLLSRQQAVLPTAGLCLDEIAAAQYRYSHEKHHPTPPGPVGVVAPGALQLYSKSELWVTIEEVTNSCFSYRVVGAAMSAADTPVLLLVMLCVSDISSTKEVLFPPVSWLICRFVSRITNFHETWREVVSRPKTL